MRKRKPKVRYKVCYTGTKPQKHLFFSLPAVQLLLDATLYFEDAMIVSNHPSPHKALAHETVLHIKTKLMAMLELKDWQAKVPLDYNEKLILNAALHMYLVSLKHFRDASKIEICVLLCQQFRKLVKECTA